MLDKNVFLTPNDLDRLICNDNKNFLIIPSNWGSITLQQNLEKLKHISPWGEKFALPSMDFYDLEECPKNARKVYVTHVNNTPLPEEKKKKFLARGFMRGEFNLFLPPSYYYISFLSLPNPSSPLNHNFIYICDVVVI